MSIYERPTKSLMGDWVKEAKLVPGRVFKKSEAAEWFAKHYPKIKRKTVEMHVEGMSVNNPVRRHHSNIKPGSGHDMFYKMGPDQFRLWVPESDPPAKYSGDFEKPATDIGSQPELPTDEQGAEGSPEFAFERDLRNYLLKNLGLIEPGLKLYDEEGITGVEFPVGGRFIDILAVDKDGRYVVFELKVSRGYDRVVGQILRYMSWVDQNMESPKPSRGIIVANEITEDLKLAAGRIPDVRLIEYKISFKLSAI